MAEQIQTRPEPAELARLWRDVYAIARAGLARGYARTAVAPAVMTFAHNMRGGLHLLDAHKLALEAIREAGRAR